MKNRKAAVMYFWILLLTLSFAYFCGKTTSPEQTVENSSEPFEFAVSASNQDSDMQDFDFGEVWRDATFAPGISYSKDLWIAINVSRQCWAVWVTQDLNCSAWRLQAYCNMPSYTASEWLEGQNRLLNGQILCRLQLTNLNAVLDEKCVFSFKIVFSDTVLNAGFYPMLAEEQITLEATSKVLT